MAEFMQFLVTYGYLVIFVWVLLEQAGLPVPAVPLLLAAGALVGLGELNIYLVLAATLAASLPVDLFWFWLGRTRGGKVLNLLCAISLEPDYCVRNTESIFNRLGAWSLIVANFVPGLQTLAPPMAGLTGMSVTRFILLDALGTGLYALILVGVGATFAHELETLAMQVASFGLWAGAGLVVIVLGWLGQKVYQRRKFLKTLEMRRLTVKEAWDIVRGGEDVHVLDLRHDYDIRESPERVPGALNVPMHALEKHAHRIPRDSDIILYCS